MLLSQYAPVSGTVQEVNETLSGQPGLLNKSAEAEGKYIFN
jgi:glycine cleavage system H protein